MADSASDGEPSGAASEPESESSGSEASLEESDDEESDEASLEEESEDEPTPVKPARKGKAQVRTQAFKCARVQACAQLKQGSAAGRQGSGEHWQEAARSQGDSCQQGSSEEGRCQACGKASCKGGWQEASSRQAACRKTYSKACCQSQPSGRGAAATEQAQGEAGRQGTAAAAAATSFTCGSCAGRCDTLQSPGDAHWPAACGHL